MKIKNQMEAQALIADLNDLPKDSQRRALKSAVEHLELDQMYYEQKGNEQAVLRCEECLAILQKRVVELE